MALIHRIHDSRYLELEGIMGYEAQIAGVYRSGSKSANQEQHYPFFKAKIKHVDPIIMRHSKAEELW